MTLPTVEHLPVWRTPVAVASNSENLAWWEKFNDPKLGVVMRQAFASNSDLLAAAYRVKSAQLTSGLVSANGSVGLGATASINHSQDLRSSATANASGANVLLSFEVDLWGKLARQRDVAQWQAQATQNDCESISLALSGTVATLYWQIAQLNQLIALGEADIDYVQKTKEIIDSKFDAGAVSGIAKAQAAVSLATQRAAQQRLTQSRIELRHAMSVLLAKPPNQGIDELAELPAVGMPALEASLPAEVLGKRPDLHAAELRLRASFTNIDVVRTSFYPSLSLTSGVGTTSTELLSLTGNPVFLLGAALTLPFIQSNTLKLNVQVSQMQFDEAVALFRQRLYTALTEVEDALSAREQLEGAYQQELIARDQAALAESMTETRYRSGFIEFQLWLDAKQVLRSADRTLIYTRFSQLTNEAKLYKALGAWNGSPAGTCGAHDAS
jgi:NodT family efflux transporter outer membrane factor (OMF) lipoprotein